MNLQTIFLEGPYGFQKCQLGVFRDPPHRVEYTTIQIIWATREVQMRTEIDFGGIPVLQDLLRIVGESHLVRFDAIEYNPLKKRRVEDVVMVKLVIPPGI